MEDEERAAAVQASGTSNSPPSRHHNPPLSSFGSGILPSLGERRHLSPLFPLASGPSRRNRSASEATASALLRPPFASPPPQASSASFATADRPLLPPLPHFPAAGNTTNSNGLTIPASSSASPLPPLSRLSSNIRRSNTISAVLHSPLGNFNGSTNMRGDPRPFTFGQGQGRPSSLSVSSYAAAYPSSGSSLPSPSSSSTSSSQRIFSRNFSSEALRGGSDLPMYGRQLTDLSLGRGAGPAISGVPTMGLSPPPLVSPSTAAAAMEANNSFYNPDANPRVDNGDSKADDDSPRKLAKTHVPSACLNCKRAHLACDVNRPCRRCVNLGKVDTCVDVRHKKRGRPRLRDREISAQSQQSVHPSPPGGGMHGMHAQQAHHHAPHTMQPVSPYARRMHGGGGPPLVSMVLSTSLYCARCSVESMRMLGYDAHELIDQSLFDLVHPADVSRVESLWTALIEPVHIRPQGFSAHPDTISVLSPAELMRPAMGTVFLQEDRVRLRLGGQHRGAFQSFSIRLHLGGGLGADLYREQTLNRSYIVASISQHFDDVGGDEEMDTAADRDARRRRYTEGSSSNHAPSHRPSAPQHPYHPEPDVLRQARWHDGFDPRHFVSPPSAMVPAHPATYTTPPTSFHHPASGVSPSMSSSAVMGSSGHHHHRNRPPPSSSSDMGVDASEGRHRSMFMVVC